MLKTAYPAKTHFCWGGVGGAGDIIIHIIIRITKWHNSCNTDPSAPIFLSNIHYLMVKVWCKFEQNRTKAIKVIYRTKALNTDRMTEFQNHGHAENSIPR